MSFCSAVYYLRLNGDTTYGGGTGGSWAARTYSTEWVTGYENYALAYKTTGAKTIIGEINDFSFTGSFTYDFWVYVYSFTSLNSCFVDNYRHYHGYLIRPTYNSQDSSAALQFITGNSSCFYYTTTKRINTNQWYNIRVVFDASNNQAIMYVNKEVWLYVAVVPPAASGKQLQLGTRIEYPNGFTNGIIDELRIWDTSEYVGFENKSYKKETPKKTLCFPNPFNTYLYISSEFKTRIFDINGKLKATIPAASMYNLNTNAWKQGVYLVTSGKTFKRIVKIN